MKTNHILLFAVTLITTMFCAAQEPPAPLTVAVLDFQVSAREFEHKGVEAAILVNAQLSTSSKLIMVERQEIEKLLGEQEMGLSGTVDPNTAARIGNLLGAKVLVTGRLFQSGKQYFLTVKMISTETSRVYAETEPFPDLDQLDKAARILGEKAIKVIIAKGETLIAKVETTEERMSRWKKLVEGRKLPSVAIHVEEQHLTRVLPDPAVETEFRLLLAQLGFKIIDQKESRESPQVEITGKAFSELAGRKGNLVSCRARVEVRVVRRENGQLLLTERQVESGIDLAENIAAKTALQNAAVKLMDRVVPALLKD